MVSHTYRRLRPDLISSPQNVTPLSLLEVLAIDQQFRDAWLPFSEGALGALIHFLIFLGRLLSPPQPRGGPPSASSWANVGCPSRWSAGAGVAGAGG